VSEQRAAQEGDRRPTGDEDAEPGRCVLQVEQTGVGAEGRCQRDEEPAPPGGFRLTGAQAPPGRDQQQVDGDRIGAALRPIAPAGSTLPRLAAGIRHTFALIDPRHRVEGVTRQLEELVDHLSPESIDLLDVGGDLLARGDEPTLKSPLADADTLAACCQANAPVRLLVAGPGLDGELPLDELRGLLGPLIHTLTAKDIEPISSVLEWHPSEASRMFAATARGVRGTCEMRDAGLPVPLTDEGPKVHEVDLDEALTRNQLARAILTTATLDQAEAQPRNLRLLGDRLRAQHGHMAQGPATGPAIP
jgi:hypothetical protein